MAAEQYLREAEKSSYPSLHGAESYDQAAVALAFVYGEETPEVAEYKEKALLYYKPHYKKENGDRARVQAESLSDRLWAASNRYFLEDTIPFVEELMEGRLFSAVEKLENLAEEAGSGYQELQSVLAKLNMRIARDYLKRGSKRWSAFYLEKVASCLGRAGRTEAANKMYAWAAKMWLRAAEDTPYREDRPDLLLSASQAFEKAGDRQGAIDAQKAAAHALVRNASYAENSYPPQYAAASRCLYRAVLLFEKSGSKEEVALQKENLKRVNELAAEQFRALQERRTAEIDGVGSKATGGEISAARVRFFNNSFQKIFQQLGIKQESVYPYGPKVDAYTAHELKVTFEEELGNAADPFLRAYYRVLVKQCEVVEEMAEVMKKTVSFPPTREELIAYAIGEAFHRYADAFFVHVWEVKGCGDNIGKPKSWADVTERREYSPDGRWVVDCEGFAYLAITFFRAAGYQVISGDMMAVGKKNDGHAFSVVRHGKTGEMIYTSNTDVFYTRPEIEKALSEMDLPGVPEILGRLPAGR